MVSRIPLSPAKMPRVSLACQASIAGWLLKLCSLLTHFIFNKQNEPFAFVPLTHLHSVSSQSKSFSLCQMCSLGFILNIHTKNTHFLHFTKIKSQGLGDPSIIICHL